MQQESPIEAIILLSNSTSKSNYTMTKPYISFNNEIIKRTTTPPLVNSHKRSAPENDPIDFYIFPENFEPCDAQSKNSHFNSGPWTEDEHKLFLKALSKYGNQWEKVQEMIKTRSCIQVRSHSQKYFASMKAKALKKLKNEGKEKQVIFLVTREYRNLNHIIQRNPIELLVDPVASTKTPKNTKISMTQSESLSAIQEEIKIEKLSNIGPGVDHSGGNPDGKINETLLYNNLRPIYPVDIQNEEINTNMDIFLEQNSPSYKARKLSFSSANIDINYDRGFISQTEVNGFLSKISYDYN